MGIEREAFDLLKADGVSQKAAADRAHMTYDRVRQWVCRSRPSATIRAFENFLKANGYRLKVERLQDGRGQ